MPKHSPTGNTILAKLTRRQKMIDEGIRFGTDQGYFEPKLPDDFDPTQYLEWVEKCGGQDDSVHRETIERAREIVGRYRLEKGI